MLRIPHCLDNRLIDGAEVVSITHRPWANNNNNNNNNNYIFVNFPVMVRMQPNIGILWHEITLKTSRHVTVVPTLQFDTEQNSLRGHITVTHLTGLTTPFRSPYFRVELIITFEISEIICCQWIKSTSNNTPRAQLDTHRSFTMRPPEGNCPDTASVAEQYAMVRVPLWPATLVTNRFH
jgi:hypothetical protein